MPARRIHHRARSNARRCGPPPFLTNDPGTPGNGNWEINLAVTKTSPHGLSVWRLPQLDVNYGLGGLVIGGDVGARLELDAEFYNDHVHGAAAINTLDLGGRYKLRQGLNLLFMAGRSVLGRSGSEVEFTGYLGIQILE